MRKLALVLLTAFAAQVAVPELADARKGRPGAAARAKHRKKRRRAQKPIPPLTRDGLPNVLAASALVVDLDSGEELYAKQPDAVRAIASVGKLLVAITVMSKGLPLDGQTTITAVDRKYARGGARSRLKEGLAFTNHDLLRAMLIASDNRAVTALARGAGLTPDELVAAANAKARELGLRRTRFTDPVGLRGNESTARELAIILRAALEDPVLAEVLATPTAIVRSTDGKYAVQYFSTNHSLRAGRHRVLGGKTGYTDAARYCLAIAAELAGRRIGMIFLGEEGELTRFGDFGRAADWIVDGGPARGKAPAAGAGTSIDPPPPALIPKVAP